MTKECVKPYSIFYHYYYLIISHLCNFVSSEHHIEYAAKCAIINCGRLKKKQKKNPLRIANELSKKIKRLKKE